MERTPVASSSIRSIGFDPSTNTLEVEFHESGVYQYMLVPASIYAECMRADSVGRFINEHVKDRYPFRHID